MKKQLARKLGRTALALYVASMAVGLPVAVCLLASGAEPPTAYAIGSLVSVVVWEKIL